MKFWEMQFADPKPYQSMYFQPLPKLSYYLIFIRNQQISMSYLNVP